MMPPAEPRLATGHALGPDRSASAARRRRGLSGVELIVILAVVAFFGLLFLIVLPRGRETARATACQRNLMQIGLAVQLYAQASRHFPIQPGPGQPGDSTLRALLDGLTLPDFLDLRDPTTPPKPGQVPQAGTRVPGLACPSDPSGGAGASVAAVSYRANAGDRSDGSDGPFAPGILVTPARVEAANGLSYTAGFAERLLGTGRGGQPGPMNYQFVAGPIDGKCPSQRSDAHFWHGDAGSSWAEPGWRSNLYSHVLEPNALLNCLAEDEQTATMTASSAHPERVHVALLDGSVRSIKPSVNSTVWHRLGTIRLPPAGESDAAP